jgi:hypothetical protein
VVLLQLAWLAQSSVPRSHSSRSAQLRPSPVVPPGQLQRKAPVVFSHSAAAAQSSLPRAHSSMSTQAPFARSKPAPQPFGTLPAGQHLRSSAHFSEAGHSPAAPQGISPSP